MSLADRLAGPIEPWRLELIARYAASVAASAPRLEARYPGHDVEPLMFQALYIAALTWRPGPAGFHRWYRLHLASQMGPVVRLRARRARGLKRPGTGPKEPGPPIRILSFEGGDYDERFYYRDPQAA